jgi:dihydrodipicolinate synthase/N-acetylneuraminate lyase
VSVISELRQRVSNLVGIKVSDAPFERAKPYLQTGLDVFIGAESVLLEGLAHGAAGAASGVAGAFPELVSALVRDPTPERGGLIASLREILAKHSVQPSVKAALELRGVPMSRDVRAPLRPLTAAAAAELRSDLENLLGADALSHPAAA